MNGVVTLLSSGECEIIVLQLTDPKFLQAVKYM